MYLKSKGVDLRKPFIDELLHVADEDERLIFITMDVGFSFLEPVEKKLGKRYLNLGITEPSSMVTAAALALDGWKPYIYSMINFVTFRCHEQLRNAVCMHKANVKILGVEGSSKYSFLGFSHNLIYPDEDIDFMSKLPNIEVYAPKTEDEAKAAFKDSYNATKAAYIRL